MTSFANLEAVLVLHSAVKTATFPSTSDPSDVRVRKQRTVQHEARSCSVSMDFVTTSLSHPEQCFPRFEEAASTRADPASDHCCIQLASWLTPGYGNVRGQLKGRGTHIDPTSSGSLSILILAVACHHRGRTSSQPCLAEGSSLTDFQGDDSVEL